MDFLQLFWLTAIPSLIPTAWKLSKYEVFSGPFFPVFGLNTGKYGLEKSSYLDTFHAVSFSQKPREILGSIPFYYLQIFLTKEKSAIKFFEWKLIFYKKASFLYKNVDITISICNKYFYVTKIIHARNFQINRVLTYEG